MCYVASIARIYILLLGAGIVLAGNVADELVDAASSGDVARLSDLLSQGAKVNTPRGKGHDSAFNRFRARVCSRRRLLLQHGADLHRATRDAGEATPLFLAAREGNDEVVRALPDFGADVNRPGKDGYTALMRAARGNHATTIQILVDHGARVEREIRG